MACTEIHFIKSGVKVNGTYYNDNLLAKKLLSDTFWLSQGGVLSFNLTVHWRTKNETLSLSWSESARLHSSNNVAAQFTGSEASRLLHLECTVGESLPIQNS